MYQRGILGQAPGAYGVVRYPHIPVGGYVPPDAGNNYGSNQMAGAGNYGNNQMTEDYGGNQMGGNYGGSSATGSYGANQAPGGYGSGPVAGSYGTNQGAGNYGANQGVDNYGANQGAGNYGANQGAGNYGANQGAGNYGANQGAGNYGANQEVGSYGANQGAENYGDNGYGDNSYGDTSYGDNSYGDNTYGDNSYGGGNDYGNNDYASNNYGGNQVSNNYEGNQVSGGYGGGNQAAGNYGGNQAPGNFESTPVRAGNYGNSPVKAGNFGGNQKSGNFGSNQASGNFASNQTPGNFGGNQAPGSFGGIQKAGNLGGAQAKSGNFGGNQKSGNFGGNQKSGNFGGNQKSGNFGGNQKSGNFGGNQRSGNFGGNQMSGNYGGNQRSGNYGGNQMRSGNFGGNQMPGNFGGNQGRAGNFGKGQMGGNFGNRQMPPFHPAMDYPEPPMRLPMRDFDMPFFPLGMPFKMPRPLMETPTGRGFLMGGRLKRFYEDDLPPFPAKRARPAGPPPGPVLPPKVKNNFLVPVSEGTEKITMDIWNYFLSARMEESDVKRKLRLRKCIMAIVGSAFPNCSLFIVGSSMTGFATKGSDVDMCLMISQEEIDQRRDASIILNSISKALRQCSCLDHRQVIKAKVPILKFFDRVSGVDCDLNVNNLIGVRNTHLLRFYAYMDWRVRPLMLFIKKWARYQDINDASKQTISSYSLTLMLIHYLQVGVSPPVVPCLQETKPELFDPSLDVRQLSLNFEPYLDFVSENRATLGELFLGFLDYYANQFSFEDQIISVRLGRLLTLDEVASAGNTMQWKFLNIEEPFEKTNTARSVYDKFVFTRVQRVFKSSHQTLDKTRDLERILMRPF